MVGSIFWGAAIAVLFGLPVHASPLRGLAALFAAFVAVTIGQMLYHVPYSAMLAEMTQDSRERISLASWKEGVSRIGVLLAATTTPIVVSFYPVETTGYRVAGLILGSVVAGGGPVAFLATATGPMSGPSEHRIPWREQIAAMAADAPFRRLVGAYALIMMADEIFSFSLIFYAVNVLGQTTAFVAKAYPINSIAAILTIPVWNVLAARNGKSHTLTIAILGMACCWLVATAIPASHAWLMLPLMGLGGAFNAGLLMLPNAMVADTVEYDAANVGQRCEGAIYGARIFCQQSAIATGGFVLSLALGIIGYHAGGLQAPSVLLGLTVAISLLPAILLLLRQYTLTEKRLTELVRSESAIELA